MDMFQLIVAFFVGGQVILILMLKYIFDSYSVSSQFLSSQLEKMHKVVDDKCREFDEVTMRASKANNSLAEKAAAYDDKIAVIENKINMMNLKFNGR